MGFLFKQTEGLLYTDKHKKVSATLAIIAMGFQVCTGDAHILSWCLLWVFCEDQLPTFLQSAHLMGFWLSVLRPWCHRHGWDCLQCLRSGLLAWAWVMKAWNGSGFCLASNPCN